MHKTSALSLDSPSLARLKTDAHALQAFTVGESDASVRHLLQRMGRLNANDASGCKTPLLHLLDKPNADIRELAIKNLAKLKDESLLPTFARVAGDDDSTQVRREAVAAMGRLRCRAAIPHLLKMLRDDDPKVILQAIRGLQAFADELRVKAGLRKVAAHPNELIQRALARTAKGKAKSQAKADAAHADCPLYMRDVVVHGDVAEVLAAVPDESVHLTFTSPPYYNARDYSIYPSYAAYLEFLEGVFAAVHRVTKEGRFFVLNTSPIIIPRISRAHASIRYPIPYDLHPLLVKMGWEFVDDIVWVKPEASVKNRTAGFSQHRKPLAYKPNAVTEMLMVYRKASDALLDWNIRQYDAATVAASRVQGEYETTNVWRVDPTFDRVHSAVFPRALCERVIRYYSFAGDLVFDPFGGSGTVGRAAAGLGRHFFLTEKERRYVLRMKESFAKNDSVFAGGKARPRFVTKAKFAAATAVVCGARPASVACSQLKIRGKN